MLSLVTGNIILSDAVRSLAGIGDAVGSARNIYKIIDEVCGRN